MHFSHASFRSICCIPALFLQGLILWQMSCSWPSPPAKEGGEARASCYHAVTMLLPCCYHAVTMLLPCCYHATATSHSPDRWRVGHIGGAPRHWRQTIFKSGSVFIRSVAAPFLEIWVWRKIERVVFSDTWWVPWHTGDTYSCIKDGQKCILHDRSPLSIEIVSYRGEPGDSHP